MLAELIEQFWSGWELLAVIAAVAYLLLAMQQNIACWLFAAVSTSIYIYLFIDARLYMESALNVFYLAMAIYGWTQWQKGRVEGQARPVVCWPLRHHVIAAVALVLLAATSGYFLSHNSNAAYPYIDSTTTWFAIWATYLVTQKVLENWWYWLVIDLVSIAIYWSRGLELTALLFVIYVVIIPFGYLAWRKSLQARVA